MTKQFESLLRARRNPSWLKGRQAACLVFSFSLRCINKTSTIIIIKGAQKWEFGILSSFIGATTLAGVHDAAYSMEGRTLLQPLLG